MAVVRSLFGRFSKDASSDLEVADNIVCLSDDDRVVDNPRDSVAPSDDFVLRDSTDAPQKFSLGIKTDDLPRQTLGELMTRTREQSGLSREQVAEQTHIPAYYVRMIESDSYDAIPDQLYLLPFFRRYAIFLGLDAQKVVARFIRDFEKAESEIILDTKAPGARDAKNLQLWRQVASGVLVVGLVLTFLTRGFGFVGGTAQRTLQHPSSNPSIAATSAETLPPSIILSSDEPRPADAEPPAAVPSAAIAAPEIAAASAPPAIGEAPSATHTTHHRHRVHGHRIAKHSRHTTHKPG
jgi:cytoskeletal protein RodZ